MGNKIREYRKKKKMTQAELAQKSGVSRVTISQLEAGIERNTSSKTLLSIAKALNSTVDEIFFTTSV
jgi:putative transcriptional regulator|nr:MAG TPA: helix-turn-helix domain protein [Caudoviricetes sp.]